MAKSNKNLFTAKIDRKIKDNAPLSVRMRPETLAQFVGQKHFLGPGKLLRRMLEADRLTSVIFYGPPGCGKTSLAHIIANHTSSKFNYLSAPSASVKDIREIVELAKDRLFSNSGRTVLFIDEIHRFSRTQQDSLLDDVEKGVVILIGATTENPFFAVNSPLISRSTVFQFEPLSDTDIIKVLNNALSDHVRGLGNLNIKADESALKYLAQSSDGDVRRALNALEIAAISQKNTSKDQENSKILISIDTAKESIQQKSIQYDGSGDSHYDLASAFQKSMRGSDPDAVIYWLARMIAGGEDPRFIARRIAVCAAEDVGNADPAATILAAAALQISEFVGMPEAQLPLAQAALYAATAPKSNACASAIWDAISDVKNGKTIPVPPHLKDSHYPGAAKLGHGQGYKYPHNSPQGYCEQDYLGAELGKQYYKPTNRGREKNITEYLQKLQNQVKQMNSETKK